MKKIIQVLLVFLSFTACEDVIQVNVPNEPPRLVIDASINWFKGTLGNKQSIFLSLTAPYFDSIIPPATGATVKITNTKGTVFTFLEQETPGHYSTNNFEPQINETYTLTILYENNLYTATETMFAVTKIDHIAQRLDGGFDGKTTEIKAYYKDPVGEQNYYLYEFKNETSLFPRLVVYSDEFSNSNEFFAFYSDEDLKPGQKLDIKAYGISDKFYTYMSILLQQNNENNGGPFETQPAIVKGNCANTTNKDYYPLGYFRLSEADRRSYLVH
ncbi:DUF4249 domain-containing protein [Flavobacteriaceae bacterium F08102]|nr:DUF4249 domain-containing protein [Flavobacteriaceae bacterium F08102]